MDAGPEDPIVGRVLLNRYRVDKRLGEGGMGAVYLAAHVTLEKPLALKVLHPEYARKEDLVERFLIEAKAASKIRHDNVIDISDFGKTEDGLVFFAMEFLKGRDLHDELARAHMEQTVLPWERSKHIFVQMCSALAAAHDQGIVHRDLKPENIYLIERMGRTDFVKLLDFGIAKSTELAPGDRKLTRTGMLFGTPEYMSPEQASGQPVDHRVDIYAMGCILYQLLVGRVPFESDNFMATLNRHLTEEPPLPSAPQLAAAQAPTSVNAVIARAMAKRPEDRFQTMREMIEAIEGLGVGSDVHPARDSAPRVVRAASSEANGEVSQPAARPRYGLLVALGAVVLVGAAAALLLFGGGDQDKANGPAPDAQSAPVVGQPDAMVALDPVNAKTSVVPPDTTSAEKAPSDGVKAGPTASDTSRAAKTTANEARRNKAKAARARAEKARAEKARADKAKAEKAKAEKAKADKAKATVTPGDVGIKKAPWE